MPDNSNWQDQLSPYGGFEPPHEEEIPTEALAADYERLAELSEANSTIRYFVRYRHAGRAHYGVLEGRAIRQLSSHFFADPRPTGTTVTLDEVRLLAPLDPNRVSKVIGAAANTVTPELASVAAAAHPRLFAKMPTSITGPGGGVEVPEESTLLVHEAELVVVIGKPARHVSVAAAGEYIFGVTAGNDLTEFDWIGEAKGRETPGRVMSKCTDTFAPIGPAIAVGLDYSDLQIVHRVNGQVTQSGSSADRLQSPAEFVSYLSRFMTLLPGDIIFTGATPFVAETPYRIVEPGQELEVEIEGIGVLRNRAVAMGGVTW